MLDRIGSYPVAERPGMSELWASDGVYPDAPIVSMSVLPKACLGYGRDDVSPKPSAFAEMVLGDFLDGHGPQRRVDALLAKATGDQELPDRLAVGTQDPSRHDAA